MIEFYRLPAASEMQVYEGVTGGRAWNDASYSQGLPPDWAANNTEECIKEILRAKSSTFAFANLNERATYADAVQDGSTEKMIVLKGLHQYKAETVGAPASAHITVAWFTYVYHLNVRIGADGSKAPGVASLGVKSATQGTQAVSSAVTGWTVATKK